MLKEIYVDIEGQYGKYQVSNYGNVKNVSRNRILKPWDNGNGYLYIACGRSKRVSVHRLVALHFLEKEDGKTEVNHKDGNKYNNCIDNLEWVTSSENSFHRQTMLDTQREAAFKFRSPDGEIFEIVNLTKFSRELGFSQSGLSNVWNGHNKSYKGWVAIK